MLSSFFFLIFILSTIISAQTTIINLGDSRIGTIASGPSVNYAINVPPGSPNFQVTFWRTNVVTYQTASVSLSLRTPNNTNLNFTGQYSGSGAFNGFYNLTISQLGTASYQYLLQACPFSCTGGSLCYYTTGNGYCHGNGACGFGGCTCDNVTSSSSVSLDIFSCSATNTSGITDLFLSLLGVWIAVIVVAFILVFIVPIIVCCCCCGMCAAAAAAHETAPIVTHSYSHH